MQQHKIKDRAKTLPTHREKTNKYNSGTLEVWVCGTPIEGGFTQGYKKVVLEGHEKHLLSWLDDADRWMRISIEQELYCYRFKSLDTVKNRVVYQLEAYTPPKKTKEYREVVLNQK